MCSTPDICDCHIGGGYRFDPDWQARILIDQQLYPITPDTLYHLAHCCRLRAAREVLVGFDFEESGRWFATARAVERRAVADDTLLAALLTAPVPAARLDLTPTYTTKEPAR